MRQLLVAALLLPPGGAAAESQLQLDGGLSVIGAGYEHALTSNVSLQVEAFIFGTYFLPWFDAGDDVKGVGAGLRPTWFQRDSHHGLYVTPYLRAMRVDDKSLVGMDGNAISAGVFVGWGWGLSDRLDLRIGAGAQYIYAKVESADGDKSASTPFVALDAILGYRL